MAATEKQKQYILSLAKEVYELERQFPILPFPWWWVESPEELLGPMPQHWDEPDYPRRYINGMIASLREKRRLLREALRSRQFSTLQHAMIVEEKGVDRKD